MKKGNLIFIVGGLGLLYYFFMKNKTKATALLTPAAKENESIRSRRIQTFPSQTPSTSNNPAQNAYILEGQVIKPPYPIMDIYIILNGQKVPFNGWESYQPYAPYNDIAYEIFEPIPYADANLRFDGRVEGGKVIAV
jgi:hypothetical protein